MLRLRPRVLALWLGAFAVLTGCFEEEVRPVETGGAGGSGGSGGAGAGTDGGGGQGAGYEGPCTPLSVGDTSIFFGSFARLGLQAPVLPVVPGLARTRLTMELYEDETLPMIEPGSFPFSEAPDDNYGTCHHCVLLVAYDLAGMPKRAFYPKNGSLDIDALSTELFSEVVGRARGMELVEVVQEPDFTWHELEGGDCYYVPDWAFDTRVVDGGACESAEQCPNEAAQICEPLTATCGPAQCSLTGDPPFCTGDQVCLSQLFDPDQTVSGAAVGACYDTCDATDIGSCGDGSVCRPLGPTQDLGVCYRSGTAAIGSECTARDISTECEVGAVCTGEPGECARICSFLTAESGCDDQRYCTLANLCERAETGDAASVGEVCSSSSPELVECGIEGDAFRGLCLKFFFEDTELSCERLCRTAEPDCPGEEECLGIFSNPVVGICRAPAVCGDGETDVVGGEICDDGNQQSGDGCAADCRSAELAELCDEAEVLVSGDTVSGDTTNGLRGYTSGCDIYAATPVSTFSFDPPASGRLRVHLVSESDADLGLSVLADCADSGSELGCQNLFGDDTLDIEVLEDVGPVLIQVRGASPNQAGPFLLDVTFTEAVCGDGEVVGGEVCDDGNTAGGDGCSADCSSVDWDFVCAALPELVLGAQSGDTSANGTSYFELAGFCSFVGGGGRERAYRFQAPSTGTLTLTLTQPEDNFSLYIGDGCGPASEEDFVGCSNFAFVGREESSQVVLEAGQVVTVIVDGFMANDEGPYTLTASFAED